MITRRAAALVQINASFRIAQANVISGTKNTNAYRITTIANNERKSPIHVAGETLFATPPSFVITRDAARILFVPIGFH
jgi:hypothetical protein